MEKRTKTTMGNVRQLRFPKDVEDELQKIADANGIQWVDAVRMVAKVGLPILKRRMGAAIKEAA